MAEDTAEPGSRKDPQRSKRRLVNATLTGFFQVWLNWTLDVGLWQQQQAIPPCEFRFNPRLASQVRRTQRSSHFSFTSKWLSLRTHVVRYQRSDVLPIRRSPIRLTDLKRINSSEMKRRASSSTKNWLMRFQRNAWRKRRAFRCGYVAILIDRLCVCRGIGHTGFYGFLIRPDFKQRTDKQVRNFVGLLSWRCLRKPVNRKSKAERQCDATPAGAEASISSVNTA
jgi:hypothetical protein